MLNADYVIVGSGIAGLRAALELAPRGSVLVLTKDAVAESATHYAQGGIAAALGEDDAVELHEQDTLIAGDGLCTPEAVRVLVEEGPQAIRELLEWGADFDRVGGDLARTREAAHSRSRILHAHGDSTGREIAETLARRVGEVEAIRILPHALATRLLTTMTAQGPRVTGIEYLDQWQHRLEQVACRAVLLATGGLGQIFSDTTNPAVATGDGPALAWDAGARLADMEFVQFHPTALAFPGAPRFLLSEALRGEGAILRNPAGERFMTQYHPDAELAPRDVVSRAVEREIRKAAMAEAPQSPGAMRPSLTCYLDATHLPAGQLEQRFPRIASTLKTYGLNLASDWIPIRTAAHYSMGGVWTGLDGRSSLPGLYAAGETACTGVHGANRLASNSLLEGLVFGIRAARSMANEPSVPASAPQDSAVALTAADAGVYRSAIATLRRLMWECAGVIRNAQGLQQALDQLQQIKQQAPSSPAMKPGDDQEALRAARQWHSVRTTAEAVLHSALAREESRGGHFREDFPHHRDDLAGRHSFQDARRGVWFCSGV